jgi:DnaJ domain
MAAIYTHYDNLKVARNAPPEVIRAAYKTLSQKYHPDRNSDKDAQKIMTIINASYDVLSDPIKRIAHDAWIAQQEAIAQQTHAPPPHPAPQPEPLPLKKRGAIRPLLIHLARYWALYTIAVVFTWISFSEPSPPPPGPKPYNATPSAQEPKKPAYVKPVSAPNGKYWPKSAGYVPGYEQLDTDGLSSVTIDNSQNDSDVFVKLVSLAGAEAYPSRQMYIPAFGKFTAKNVRAGSYDVRYKDLDTGGLSRSEAFELEETPTDGGTQYSEMSMTLYKVQEGNMQTFPLAESEF